MCLRFLPVKIKYDDMTSEVTRFPDKDVVVDDYLNGKHQWSAEKFIPPYGEDGEVLFGGGSTEAATEAISKEMYVAAKEEGTAISKVDSPPMAMAEVVPEAFAKAAPVGTAEASSEAVTNAMTTAQVADAPQAKVEVAPEERMEDVPEPEGVAVPETELEATPPEVTENVEDGEVVGSTPRENSHSKPFEIAGPPKPVPSTTPGATAQPQLRTLPQPSSDPLSAVTKKEVEVEQTEPETEKPEADTTLVAQSIMPTDAVANVASGETEDARSSAVSNQPDEDLMPPPQRPQEESQIPVEVTESLPLVLESLPKHPVPGVASTLEETTEAMEVEPIESTPTPIESTPGALQQTGSPMGTDMVTEESPPLEDTPTSQHPVQSSSPMDAEPPKSPSSGPLDNVDNAEMVAAAPSDPVAPADIPVETTTDGFPSAESMNTEVLDGVSSVAEPSVSQPVVEVQTSVENVQVPAQPAFVEEPSQSGTLEESLHPGVVEEPLILRNAFTGKDEPVFESATGKKEQSPSPIPTPPLAAVEEPAKPKRKRGRPPKQRPPADVLSPVPEMTGATTPDDTYLALDGIEGTATTVDSQEAELQSGAKAEKEPAAALDLQMADRTKASSHTDRAESIQEQQGQDILIEGAISSKPALTIRIPNIKRVESQHNGSAEKGEESDEKAVMDVPSPEQSPRGTKRSKSEVEEDEPPAKRLHIHLGSKVSRDNLPSASFEKEEEAPTAVDDSTKSSKSNNELESGSTEQSALSPRPKKQKRKRDRDGVTTPRPSSKATFSEQEVLAAEAASVDGQGTTDKSLLAVDTSTLEHGEQQGSKVSATAFDESDQILTPNARTKPDSQSAARSGRRAAQQANERISTKNELPADQASKKKKKKRKEMDADERDRDDEIPSFQWVQCDKCAKWRIIPSSVVEKLPALWYCADNKWDARRGSCDAPEQTPKQVAKERKRKKRKLMMEREAANLAQQPVVEGEAIADPPSSHPTGEKVAEPTRASPSETSLDSGHATGEVKADKKAVAPSKKSKSVPVPVEPQAPAPVRVPTPAPEDDPKPRSRGRPRRNPPKESTTPAAPTDDADNLEWVQCEKCDKWRKLPPHISADELPDVWYCSMNTWNPGSASCSAAEDKADGLQDIFNNNTKLSYRNLIFGSNGRKANRPISERTRAAESLFTAISDDSDAPPTVMYANSSAFVSRSKLHQVDENEGPSVLDLMSHSHLWNQLRETPKTVLNFDALSSQARESMKDICLHYLGAQTLTGDQVHQQVRDRDWENAVMGWVAVRSYCTENMIVMTLCELVKKGLLECFRVDGTLIDGYAWTTCFRRATTRTTEPSTCPVDLPPTGSGSMKFSKPWKRLQQASLKE
jgi:hypothetical protein